MYSCGPLHMAEQRQDDQLEPTYSNSVWIRNVTLKTCRKQWTIEKGGEREHGISALMVRGDDDDFSRFNFRHGNFNCFLIRCCIVCLHNFIFPMDQRFSIGFRSGLDDYFISCEYVMLKGFTNKLRCMRRGVLVHKYTFHFETARLKFLPCK